jgi:hypothetical protein
MMFLHVGQLNYLSVKDQIEVIQGRVKEINDHYDRLINPQNYVHERIVPSVIHYTYLEGGVIQSTLEPLTFETLAVCVRQLKEEINSDYWLMSLITKGKWYFGVITPDEVDTFIPRFVQILKFTQHVGPQECQGIFLSE